MLTHRLIADVIEKASSWTERAKSLERLATRFVADELDRSERLAATETFRVMLYDGEPLVRLVLAASMKASPDAPSDVVLALARDVATVAAPILEHSPLLDEDELLAVAQRASPAHRLAIAGRQVLSTRLVAALCRAGERAVILRLLGNAGAAITGDLLNALLERFPDDATLGTAIARRRLLSVGVGDRVVAAAREAAARQWKWQRTGSLG